MFSRNAHHVCCEDSRSDYKGLYELFLTFTEGHNCTSKLTNALTCTLIFLKVCFANKKAILLTVSFHLTVVYGKAFLNFQFVVVVFLS